MNTKKRLSEDIQNTKEILLEERLVTLYEDEIAHLLARKDDLEKVGRLNEEEAKEVEEAARLYNRVFARNFYETSGGRITDEEFLPLWEREDELKKGLQKIQSLEGEKKQLEKEMDIVIEEEADLIQMTKRAEEKRVNQKAVFRSFVIMAFAALIFFVAAVLYFEFPIREYVWPAVAAVLVVILFLVILYHIQKKAVESEKLYRMMSNHKFNSKCRLESDYQNIGNDLKYYYEKFEVLFGYISEEQWKLFEFCAKVSAGLKFCGEIEEKAKELRQVLDKYHLEEIDAWLYYPKALYEIPKRIQCLERLNYRQNICEQAMVKHEREINQNRNNE